MHDARCFAALQGEGDQTRNSVAAEYDRREAACDDREEEGGGDGILHRRGPGTVGPGLC
jgi:hypothetical protein